ncbi:Conserved carboxylase region [Caldicellulosiruptor kronotskyensis 2002]|uniref:Conserved carboxylase region n=1 Tax=Caldicellulosiruptor kronotskyensis (strain DSM 18902 / VKM B-2412 / 2002) TaxID=632348 RepID=E4SDU5_CALK2|nr:oxaloacetate decarboxylase subunit alpha [Caldicellulosiruptor kronotskyensis]ADQ45232.1 Conserved carboxylase region [Caldicellulosiruptor kronotskyensis 2002]
MKRIYITETVLRDAQQSLIATRMPYEDFDGILEKIDKAGYYSIECWGGATFDSCLRYLNEDPWERLRKIRSKVKNTKLQMLLRGQNLLGYRHYPDDVVRMFVRKSIENGMDIIRIFDALNDLRNIEVAVDETIKAGGHAQGTIVYTISPIHSLEMYVKIGKDLESMGVHSICIKDMAGIMSPKEAYELVKALKENVKVPVFLHTHSTTGLGILTYLKAIEAGVDGIDTAISSFSGGTSQPPTETLSYALKQMGYDTNLDNKLLKEINDFFKPVKDKFIKNGILNPFVLSTDTDALIYQIPGGMLSNLIAQLKQQNALGKLDEVLMEVPRVREDLGYPPLVTPMSQMVGTQAAANVLSCERYKVILKEVKAYIRGEYGRPPGEINPELVKKVLGDEKPIEGRFADTLEPIFEKTKEQIKDFAKTDEDVLSYILFPQVAEEFLKNRGKKKEPRERKIEYTIEGIS